MGLPGICTASVFRHKGRREHNVIPIPTCRERESIIPHEDPGAVDIPSAERA